MQALFKPEVLFLGFLFLQFAVVFFVVIKYIVDKVVERRFEDLHQKTYPDAQIVSSGQKVPFFRVSELVLLVAGPALMAVTMVYSTYSVLNTNQTVDIRSNAAKQNLVKITDDFSVSEAKIKEWQKTLDNVPVNPNQVLATTSADGITKILTSGRSYKYPELTFTWSGDRAVEPGVKIIGYYVYFGVKNTEIPFPHKNYESSASPQNKGVFVKNNSYTAKDLEKGQTYYLYVQTVTNSENPYYKLGVEQVGYMQTLPAKKLFVYKYE